MPSDTSGIGGERPTRLQVRLLGAVEIILDGRRLRAFNSLRLQRFLGLIALRRDPQHRSRLAFELWPDSDEAQARTNLGKLLHDFRHALPDSGEFVEIDNEPVRWIATGPSEVDVLRFRDAVAAGDFELAARLYGGDLLPACYDDCVVDERATLRAEAYRVLVRLTEEAARRNDHQAALRHTQRIIGLEPTDEAAVRFQMAAHLALGDRAAALRAYHRYAEVLERELGVAPGEGIGSRHRPAPIVGTVRWEEIPSHHPLVGLVDALGHDQAVTTVPLDRLDEATTATLAARLWRETEGNPLFVIEAVRAGISSDGSEAVLTPTMRAVLLARARGMLGEFRPVRAATREALSWTQRCSQRYLEAELWRLDGELACRSGEREAAAASLRRAVEIARPQGAGWLELRALRSPA
ncbi:AfsR/SARP family transcriptional regulator [Aromatoleum aromaticum]|uniref:Bacterial transcriptional activator domain-containing protein n=1 Tax=Aromatoleum aromaticum (strain DSM 19018 / LMG 30748 / EbN1) TaxID=76114 RepID=Q5NY15_AROAE|nr:BTAD domain-containing putative transcriptional regulator [Aromatoleum aromaticum]CAI10049.1 hypothetical protein ebA6876 [Aromatoleum aromaticum EbN1]